ncbi:helix-turn-helix domain-containing protein [Actinacidiphila bryophytorum]|uniref:helix-turn-helix domain-containing protein n=1 Tax=Actinacidiphila bryophytorum TaxID=1436133 RepID=UPI001961DB39|nr:AraC family transcriptional regulator [Actinacidiphila bryophytorum]MBM9438075.1 AraC family transcriptional regulator [Actinacidiphila bryophytorum]
MRGSRPGAEVRAWRPAVAGISEVLHANFAEHAYPVHTHDTWDLMLLDDGVVDFALDRRRHDATDAGRVVLLPPGVPHDGRSVGGLGFRKRVLYLSTDVLPERLAGTAVDGPILLDPALHDRVHLLHQALRPPEDGGDVLEAESRLAFVRERLLTHLDRRRPPPRDPADHRLAARLRELLDSRVQAGLSLDEATRVLHAHPTHLIRCFTRAYGLPPHTYLTGRRIDRARALLLAGERPVDVAGAVGFYDQAHLSRHFTRHMGVPPARFGRRGA